MYIKQNIIMAVLRKADISRLVKNQSCKEKQIKEKKWFKL